MASAQATPAATDTGKFTITVTFNCGERRSISYTVFKRTLISQIFDSAVGFFKVAEPATVALIIHGNIALTTRCVDDYALVDKDTLELLQLKEVCVLGAQRHVQ